MYNFPDPTGEGYDVRVNKFFNKILNHKIYLFKNLIDLFRKELKSIT